MTRRNELHLPAGWNDRHAEWGRVDLDLVLPSVSEIKLLARKRVERKNPVPGDRIPPSEEERWKEQMGQIVRTEDRETYTRRWVGLYGERQAARELGVRMNLDVRPKGDKRVNLRTPRGVPVDVITRRSPHGWADRCPDLLLHELDAVRPELALVLVIFCGSTNDAYVVGWEWERVVRAGAKLTNHQGHGCLEYPPEKLRPIRELLLAERYVPPPEQMQMLA